MKMVMPTRDRWSIIELRHIALNIPIGTPMSQESSTAMTAICAEIGPRRRIIPLIGSLFQNEEPISPLMTCPIQFRY